MGRPSEGTMNAAEDGAGATGRAGAARAAASAAAGAALIAGLALGLAGCEPLEPIDPGNTLIEVWLTDAAASYLEVAEVDIGAVELVAAGGSVATLAADGTASPVDLMELREQDPLQLAGQDVEPGLYTQLRLEVESGRVELDAAYAFEDGSTVRDLAVPSDARSGAALNLEVAGLEDDSVGATVIDAGRLVLMVDFDVNQSFLIQGDPEAPEGIDGIVFNPKLRVVVRSVAGSVAGTVRSAAGAEVEGLTVTARPLDEGLLGPYQTQTATAATAADGSYRMPFMAAGSYAVDVDAPEGFTPTPSITQIAVGESEAVTGVDFNLDAGS
ncbi:MAG: DUF4382 domain-containing protein [Longimicrobiales bacterium]